MIEEIETIDVGPARHLKAKFKPRFNLLTGDNGLGKTFLLDAVWWTLTRTWAHEPLWIDPKRVTAPKIAFKASGRRQGQTGDTNVEAFVDTFNRQELRWSSVKMRAPYPGLVVYCKLDGGFALWDPAKHSGGWGEGPKYNRGRRPSAFSFSSDEVVNGKGPANKPVCNGAVRDWVTWQTKQSEEFRMLETILKILSPSAESEQLRVAQPMRLDVDDAREFPALMLPYGRIPLTLASAGMRRIVYLAYFLVWAWREHRIACEQLGVQPERRIVFLMDEVEAHLHPQWQRVILPAIHRVCDNILAVSDATVQLVATTHSPLILASLETSFKSDCDSLHSLEIHGSEVTLKRIPWAKQGDTVGWLVSDSFGLKQARSREAERAIEAAEALMRDDIQSLPSDLADKAAIHAELLRVLASHDPFWPRWIVKMEKPT